MQRDDPGETTTPTCPSSPQAPDPPCAQTMIARYEIVGQLGRGGMAVVCRAHDPALHHDARDAQLAAVENPRLADQAVLAEVAKVASDWEVRWAPVEKLTDQTLHAYLAKNDDNPYIREHAVRKLTDQALRTDVAKTDSDWSVRRAVVRGVANQAVLATTAMTDSSHEVCQP